jgi:ricin-type beta-trefoil lectin protein
MQQHRDKTGAAPRKWREIGKAGAAVLAAASVAAAAWTWPGAHVPGAHVPAARRGVSGAIFSGIGGKCLSDYPNYHRQSLVAGIDSCDHSSAQRWTLPGDNTIRVQGKCLTARKKASRTGIVLASCDGSGGQFWEADGVVRVPGVELLNPWSGKCLIDPRSSTVDNTQVQIYRCRRSAAETWYLPPSRPSHPTDSPHHRHGT